MLVDHSGVPKSTSDVFGFHLQVDDVLGLGIKFLPAHAFSSSRMKNVVNRSACVQVAVLDTENDGM